MPHPLLSVRFKVLRFFLFLCWLSYSTAHITQISHGPQVKPPITCDSTIQPINRNQSNKCDVSSCSKFIVTYLILLENPKDQFDNIFDFIKINTRGCTKATFFIIEPSCAQDSSGKLCSSSSLLNLYDTMESLKPESFLPDESMTVTENLDTLLLCAMHTVDNYPQDGSSIILITDITCSDFCNSNLPANFYQTFNIFANDGYDVRIFFTKPAELYTPCAGFFGSTNLDHSFGVLPLANAQSFCLPPNRAVNYCDATAASKVDFGIPFSKTNSKLIIMGFLLEYWNMSEYQNFILKIIGSCNEDDWLQILSPTLSTAGYENTMTPKNIDDFIGRTDLNTFFESNPATYESDLLKLTNQLVVAANNSSDDYNRYIYIFTDIDCPWFCSLHGEERGYPEVQYFLNNMQDLYRKGFMVRIFYLPKLSASCDSFTSYWASSGMQVVQPIPTEDFDNYLICPGKAEEKTTLTWQIETTTIKDYVLATDPPEKSEKWKMALVIGFACLCLLLLGTTIFFVILSKRRMKSRKLAVHNLRTIIGQASGQEEKGQSGETVLNENQPQHYDDYWRLSAENLLINELDVLGRGAFGRVNKGKYRGEIPSMERNVKLKMAIVPDEDGAYEVAIKRLPAYAMDAQRQELVQEIEFMKTLGQHIHVIAMLGYVDHLDDPMILLEYCEKGDLHKYLEQLRNSGTEEELNPKEFVALAWQIADGLCYLHAHNFVHRDLAARNILLTKNMVAKISDFGLCRHNDSAHYTSKGGKLPLRWMAIESLKFFEFSIKSDIWSYGVTVWELFSLGESPFQTTQGDELTTYIESGNRLEIPNTCPETLKAILSQCWSSFKEDRPLADEVRAKLAGLLDESSMYYGYLNFENDTVLLDEYVDVSIEKC